MRIRRSWVAVGAAAALGVGATTTAATALNDQGELSTQRGAIDLSPQQAAPAVDDSPESADSPNESAVESSDSPFDSPDDPGFVAPAGAVAPAPAPQRAAASADSPDAAPAPAVQRAPAPAPVYVDDATDSGAGDVSAASADSP